MIFLHLSAATMVLTGLTHSYFGEKRLIVPILASELPVANDPLGRMVIRLAWHFTTILMVLNACVMIWPATPNGLIMVTTAVWLVVGLIDAALTKGRHIGWPLITLAGGFGLCGVIL